MKLFLLLASASGALCVILGAFGAHALKTVISPDLLESYKTGVQYQFYHTLSLMVIGILMNQKESKLLKWSGLLFIAGIFLFSGSLYIMAISSIKAFGAITPFGGLMFISGWICLLIHCSRLTANQ